MGDKFNIDLLAALIDGEIEDPKIKSELESFITSDTEAATEFKIQSLIKNLVRRNTGVVSASPKLRRRVQKKLMAEVELPDATVTLKPITQQYISYATVAVIVLALILIVFNRPPLSDDYNFAVEQTGADNMFIQAQFNFQALLNDQLKTQFKSDSPEMIKNYFEKSGVKYSTIIPLLDQMSLSGAFVSDEFGDKFAHHTYSTPEGKLVYLYQVNEQTLHSGTKIKLTKGLIKYIDDGGCYVYSQGQTSTLIVKVKDNIFSVVSNLPRIELKETFCNIK